MGELLGMLLSRSGKIYGGCCVKDKHSDEVFGRPLE
jgi:hypothetical protein